MRIKKARLRQIIVEELKRAILEQGGVGIGSSQGQMGIRSKKKKDECGDDRSSKGDPMGKKAFDYEILVSGEEDLEED